MKKLIVYFGNDANADMTSRHHLAQELVKDYDLLWVESVATRNFELGRGDLMRGLQKIGKVLSIIKTNPVAVQQKHSFDILTPLPIPLNQIGIIRRFNHRRLISRITRVIKQKGNPEVILWLGYPQVSFMIGTLAEKALIYHVTDEYAEFPGVCRDEVLALEKLIMQKADLVLFSVEQLRKQKEKFCNRVLSIPHAVDYELFSQAVCKDLACPVELMPIKDKKILGFYGTIDEWLDFKLLEEILKTFPNCFLVMLGKKNVDLTRLKRYKNFLWIDRKSKSELPYYLKFFSVALIPYDPHYFRFKTINPFKAKEYLAAGTPVVSYEIPDLHCFKDIIRLSRDRNAFLAAIKDVLSDSFLQTMSFREKQSRVVKNETWKNRGEKVLVALDQLVRKGQSGG